MKRASIHTALAATILTVVAVATAAQQVPDEQQALRATMADLAANLEAPRRSVPEREGQRATGPDVVCHVLAAAAVARAG